MSAARRELLAIFAGGALGAGLRTGLVELAAGRAGQWPWVTFAVNLAGCLALGYLLGRTEGQPPISRYWRPLVGTGFCGALTTFSTLQLELVQMVDRGELVLATGYGVGSLCAGYLGIGLGSAAVGRARLTW